ncbi:TonB-dependent receptor domain-containing protein [Candidatus Neomarinimicrobiota bacterium]
MTLRAHIKSPFPLWMIFALATCVVGQSHPNSRRLASSDLEWVSEALKTPVSVSFRDTPLEEALHMIAVKGDLRLSYNRDQLPMEQQVTLELMAVPALEALLQVTELTRTEIMLTNGVHLAIVPATLRPGIIQGMVFDGATGEPLQGANVLAVGTYMGAASDQVGRFLIRQVPPGRYTMQFLMMGYKPAVIEASYDGYQSVEVNVQLEPTILSLDQIIITPGHFSLMEYLPSTRHALVAEDIRTFPQLGEDIYRAVSRLPGLASNDFAAGFYIRGGQQDEVLVLLDGMELYSPFHLKITDGFLSFIDVESIRGIDMITGAFPAEYGNRLSGVFSLKTITPQLNRSRTSLAISFLNARVLTERIFAKGRGQWMLLARRGYIDLILKAAGQEIDPPFYYDILSKIQYNIGLRHSVSAHILIAHDRLVTALNESEIDSRSDNTYGWLTWNSEWSSKLSSRTLISKGGYEDRTDMVEDESDYWDAALIVKDQRYLYFDGLKQDWTWQLSEKYLLKWGIDTRRFDSHINYYHRDRIVLGQLDDFFTYGYNLASRYRFSDGVEFSGYLAQRIRPIEAVAIEMGLRYESSTWTNDKHWSPRINLAYILSEHTSIRGGWGHYYQTHSLVAELGLYGDPEFYPAERAEHRVIGIEHEFPGGIQLRVEGYQKVLTSLRPHYITWEEATLRPVPMVDHDRIKLVPEGGEAAGIEFYLRRETGHALSYWFSYSFSKTREKVDGRWLPRFNDQTHTLYCDLSWKPNHKWRLNLAWQYHTGWPYTEAQIKDLHETQIPGSWAWRWAPGPLYAERFPAYRRIDLRLNRIFYTKHGVVTGFVEFRNLLNRYNPRKYQYWGTPIPQSDGSDEDEVDVTQYDSDGWLGTLPSFGIMWDF